MFPALAGSPQPGRTGAAVVVPSRREIGFWGLLKNRVVSIKGTTQISNSIAAITAQRNLRIYVAETRLYIMGVEGKIGLPATARLAAQLYKAGATEVAFSKGTGQAEIAAFFNALTSRQVKSLESTPPDGVELQFRYQRDIFDSPLSLNELLQSWQSAEAAAEDPCTAPEVLAGLARESYKAFLSSPARNIDRLIAENPNCSSGTLDTLFEKGDANVIISILKRADAPRYLFEKAATSRWFSVQLFLAKTTDRPEVLELLCKDSDRLIVYAAAKNQSTAPAVLDQLCSSENELIASSAAGNPKTPPAAVAKAIINWTKPSQRWSDSGDRQNYFDWPSINSALNVLKAHGDNKQTILDIIKAESPLLHAAILKQDSGK